MKAIKLFSLILILGLSACSGGNHHQYKYKIQFSLGRYISYDYFNEYTQKDNCVEFVDCDGDSIKICGSYCITKQNK